MVLKDDMVDQYINLDMTEIDINKAKDDPDLPPNVKAAC